MMLEVINSSAKQLISLKGTVAPLILHHISRQERKQCQLQQVCGNLKNFSCQISSPFFEDDGFSCSIVSTSGFPVIYFGWGHVHKIWIDKNVLSNCKEYLTRFKWRKRCEKFIDHQTIIAYYTKPLGIIPNRLMIRSGTESLIIFKIEGTGYQISEM